MRLLAFTKDHQPRFGALTDAGVINLSLVDAAAPTDLGAFIKTGRLADIAATLAKADGTFHYQLNELDLAGSNCNARQNSVSWPELYGSYCRRPV